MTFGIDYSALEIHRQRVEQADRELEQRRRIAERVADDAAAGEHVTHVHPPARGIRRLLPNRRRLGLA